ncbi:MAG: hypothetical protein ACRCZZ_07490, partial [Phocaeicola sp.]
VDLGDSGELKITATSDYTHLDSAGFAITAGKIVNEGKIRLKGAEIIIGTKENKTGSIIEYYDEILDIKNSWGTAYENLLFLEAASVDSSDAINIVGTTTIDTSGDVKLQGQNIFTGLVTITNGKSLILNSSREFTVEADVNCESLEIGSAVILNGDVVTTGKQEYKGELSLVVDETTLKGGGILFEGAIKGSGKTLVLESTAPIMGNSAATMNLESLNIEKTGASSVIGGKITVNNFTLTEGVLNIGSLEIGGNISNAGTLGIGSVVFVDGGKPSIVLGDISYENFTCIVPSKEIRFEEKKTQEITMSFTINGGGVGTRIKLLSNADESIIEADDRVWYINPKGTRDVQFVAVKDSENI